MSIAAFTWKFGDRVTLPRPLGKNNLSKSTHKTALFTTKKPLPNRILPRYIGFNPGIQNRLRFGWKIEFLIKYINVQRCL